MSKMISDKIHEFSLTYSKTLKHQVLQLEHSAHLIFLEKEIVVDKSKGLYEALNKLFTPFCIDSKLNEEFKIVKDQSARLFSLIENERKGMKQILHEREKFMNGYLQLSDLEIEYYTQKERIVRIFKERTSSMQQEISKISEEKQTISNKFTELEKKYQTCLDEFKEFRKRVRRKFVIYDKNQEKFCKNCQRSYTEHENFNWSCRTHASYYSQGFFWCCGETLKDTPGCIVSKHISNEDSEEIYGEERTANKIFCTACKSWGHGIQSCHKDPNFRSAFDINDEYQRITKIIKNQSNFNECLPRVLESDSDSESLEFTEIAKLKSECLCGQSGPCRTCKSLKAQTSLADKEPLPPTT